MITWMWAHDACLTDAQNSHGRRKTLCTPFLPRIMLAETPEETGT
ncbi:MAG: hypothetical protein SPH22_09450 [Prevotella sp.]|nr:hypothetical protein [Prevotella sp.]MDY5289843.1 hypothetical protein [Prevotella sp.]